MSTTDRLFFYVYQVEQLVRSSIENTLVKHGLTAGQYMTLNLLGHLEPITSADLARKSRITPQSMGEYVRTMEEQGWLQREVNENNKRHLLIKTTAAGKNILKKCETSIDEAEAKFFECLDPEERHTLKFMLSRVRRTAANQDQKRP